MENSHFYEYVHKALEAFVTYTRKTTNGKEDEQIYLFEKYLTPTYCPSGIWKSIESNNISVSADFVSLDSQLPLKKRGSIGNAYGEIIKSGIKYIKNETQIKELQRIESSFKNGDITERTFLENLFDDIPNIEAGFKRLMERCFLQALSTGAYLIEDSENVGLGVRMDFKVKDENKFNPLLVWSDVNAKIWSDIKRIIKKAKKIGKVVKTIFVDENTFDLISLNKEVQGIFAFSKNFVGNNIPQLAEDQIKQLFKSLLKVNLEIVDYTHFYERDGQQYTTTPWQEGIVAFVCSDKVGQLAWDNVAENANRVEGVEYVNGERGLLISEYGLVDPLREISCGQACQVPVIDNISGIFLLDTKTASVDPTEGDSLVNLWGEDYDKSDVIEQLNGLGYDVDASTTEKLLAQIINSLDKKTQNSLKSAMVAYPILDPSSLSITSTGATKTVLVKNAGTATVTANETEDWLSTSVTGNEVSIVVSANTEVGAVTRTGEVAISVGGKTSKVTISQTA